MWTKLFLLLPILSLIKSNKYVPCIEISREFRFPCRCVLGPQEEALNDNPSISVDCDRVVFADFPVIPSGAPIVSFKQRWAGYQALPSQIFSSSELPLRTIDFSGNSLRRITEKVLQGLHSTLVELRLANNLLGDTLNPIFSSSEFHGLRHLQILDLSGNAIKALEEGIFEGCENLVELYLNRNSFKVIPTSSLNGPKALRVLSLQQNRISVLKQATFINQQTLEHLDLSKNLITTIEGGSFEGLEHLKALKLAHNRLIKFNSDVFQGAYNLHTLDLSENFISEFPSIALKAFSDLKYLNISSNLIQAVDNSDLSFLVNLLHLDLSRNNIANIVPGTFLGLKQLRKLDISVNSLHTIEDDAFEGLDNLESLLLKDNNVLLIPASAVGRLPHLTSLHLDYNRVAALSGDILRSVAEQLTTLVVSKNVVRELPPATFQHFRQLRHLDLSRNLITVLNSDAFTGLENVLRYLYLSQNRITSLTGSPLALSKLELLDLSDNHLTELSKTAFTSMPNLQHLNVSHNIHLSLIPVTILHKLPKLASIDLSYTGIKTLSRDFFSKSLELQSIIFHHNDLSEISDNIFVNLQNLSIIDLSYNNINNIKHGAFVNVMNIQKLSLRNNQLNSFKGEFFNTGSSLEVLDISYNQLSYLFPSSFRIHPRLRQIFAAHNKFNFFPAELIANLQFLEYIDLSNNELKAVEEFDFAQLPHLRTLLLSNNLLDSVSEMAFHNSTQLQVLDLSYNKLERIGDRIFEGLIRLESLNLKNNLLADLPETIFERVHLQMLENINLAGNLFQVPPFKALQRQYFFVSTVDLSRNRLKEIPADDSIMVNIKELDLSFNSLSEQAIMNVLGEPKTVRRLNLAGTGITSMTPLETPFLHHLNLSYNNISELSDNIFERTTLLETLDLSNNQLSDITTTFPKLWSVLKNLRSLDLSSNLITKISQNDFEGLESLQELCLRDLGEVNKIEKNAFKSMQSLFKLNLYNLPKLGYLDVQGLLQNLPALEEVNVETKDAAIGSDQLKSVLHPRLRELGIRGLRLHSISSSTLSGIKGSNVIIRLYNTSLTTLPPTLFFPVPRSSHITLDVTGSKLTTITPQMLVALDDRRGDLKIMGLETNPIVCDCNARALRRWLPIHMTSIQCSSPEHLQGKLLVEIGDDELTCDVRKSPSTPVPSSKPTRFIPKSTEPEIIWSIASTEKSKPKTATKLPNAAQSSIGNDDTLIIGIVGGVVAFIAILIIVICIIRLRMNNNQYQGGSLSNGATILSPTTLSPGNNCPCGVKSVPPMYTIAPYAPSYATLPHKVNMSGQTGTRSAYSTMGRVPYYQNSGQPYFVALPADDKVYR